ncbi:MAG: hypothetical protein IEMM0002_0236 [bacterium]|nr:MAG: hypothetical protein IEMM0002_0236 [bacterium]
MNLPFNIPIDLSQKRRVAAVAAILIPLLLFFVVILPLQSRSKRMDLKLVKARKDLKEITTLADEYITLSAGIPRRNKKPSASTSMSAEVEKLARALGIEKNIKRMTPKFDAAKKRQEELSVTISNLPLLSLVDILEKLYRSPSGINVWRARIKAGYEKREYLDVELTLTPAN